MQKESLHTAHVSLGIGMSWLLAPAYIRTYVRAYCTVQQCTTAVVHTYVRVFHCSLFA